jgi:hypothetical protein
MSFGKRRLARHQLALAAQERDRVHERAAVDALD